MSEIKWIKISTEIFDNRKIKQIEAMPDGDALMIIWLKLLCLAGNVNDMGFVYLTKEVPYTEEMLATQFNRPITTIKLALTTFERYGMIEVINDMLCISNWEKYQNVEGMEKVREQTRKRVAKHREMMRIAQKIETCQYCGDKATGVDHIIPISRGGTDDESNLVPCCKRCNQIKNDKPLIDFLNNNRDRINDELVTKNPKLSRYVTLSNVTNRYTVTDSNAIDIDIDKDKDIYISGGRKNGKTIDLAFEKFWEVYPKKQSRPQAEHEFARALLNDVNLTGDLLVASAHNYAEAVNIEKRDERYIKAPNRFISDNTFVEYLPGNYKKPKPKASNNKFTQYQQNSYDYEALERELLSYD